jgi:hypothetical protein
MKLDPEDLESSVTESETDTPSDSESEQSANDSNDLSDTHGKATPLPTEKPVVSRKQRLDEVRYNDCTT